MKPTGQTAAVLGAPLSAVAKTVHEKLLTSANDNRAMTPTSGHYKAPVLDKPLWTQLGDLLIEKEKPFGSVLAATNGRIPGACWYTLRLDGCGFSVMTKYLRKVGVLEPKHSDTFADAMKECCKELLTHFHGVCGFTQSDEMTVVIPPAAVSPKTGEQYEHTHNGRVMKLCTVASSIVTARFLFQLINACAAKGVVFPAEKLPHFDCRVGVYDSEIEATSLIWWRAFDCSINSVSDAVYREGKAAGESINRATVNTKIQWLAEKGLLPLKPHAAYGAFYTRGVKEKQGFNPITKETVTVMRPVIVEVPGPVLVNVAKEVIAFPQLSQQQSSSSLLPAVTASTNVRDSESDSSNNTPIATAADGFAATS